MGRTFVIWPHSFTDSGKDSGKNEWMNEWIHERVKWWNCIIDIFTLLRSPKYALAYFKFFFLFSSNFFLLPFTFFLSFLLSFYSSLPPDILFTPSPLFLPHISRIRTFVDPVFYVPSSDSSQTSYIYFLSSHSNVKLIFSWYCV